MPPALAARPSSSRRRFVASRLAVVASATALVGAAGCGDDAEPSSAEGGAPAAETVTVKMGTQPWIGYGPWFIADEKGYDKQHGVDLQITSFTTDADLSAAFNAGRIDAENLAAGSALRNAAKKAAFKLVLFEDISTKADAILSGSGIGSVADLRGKRVAYEEGSTSDTLLRYALGEAGMSIDDVERVPMPAADAGAAAIAGKVDAAVTYEPYLTTALGQDDDFKLLYTAEEKPGLIADLLAVSTKLAEEQPDAVKGLLAAWDDAVDFYNSNPQEAQAIIAKGVGAKPEELETSFAGVDLFDSDRAKAFFASDWPELAKTLQDILREQGELEGSIDIAAITDTSFLEGEQE